MSMAVTATVLAMAGCQSTGQTGQTGAGAVPAAGSRTGPVWSRGAAQGWALSVPDSVLGLTRYQPPGSMLQTITSALRSNTAPLGVTGGTPVIGVYDDPKYDVYIIVAGYNGAGFDPSKLTAMESAPPSVKNVNGTRFTENHVTINPGDHGGTAGCSSSLGQSWAMAAESTACLWMTATTFGSVTYLPKPDHQKMVYGTGPEVLGPVMRSIRAQVEHRG